MISSNIIPALIMGIAVGGIAGYIGTLMVTKRMALMGGALGHLTLPGMALALLYGFDVSLGALLFLGFGIVIIWWLEKKTALPTESLTAVVFASSLAISFLFLPKDKTSQALIGNVSKITWLQVTIAVAVTLLIFLLVKQIYSKMILSSICEDLARSEGINVKKDNFIYLACIAIIVALGVRIVGGLMTAALVAIPACTSKNLSKNLFQYSYGGIVFGSLACCFGILIFAFTKIPAGPMIIISSTILFLISLIFKK